MASVELDARAPCLDEGCLRENELVRVSSLPWREVTSIAPLKGQTKSVSEQLGATTGLTLPPIGQGATGPDHEIFWNQDGQWLLFGSMVPITGAAVTDQSDG